ncbi:MAG: leucine-rich repeat domain-containing protein [Lachnospiraceae bacterium]|nr:leucine-rich repeat domain-containing protein [Lachnospiraceae bacterium]
MLGNGKKGTGKMKRRMLAVSIFFTFLSVGGWSNMQCPAEESERCTEVLQTVNNNTETETTVETEGDIAEEVKRLEQLRPETCSDEKITTAVQSASVEACAMWLSEMRYEDFTALIKRNTWLNEEAVTTEYDPVAKDSESWKLQWKAGKTTMRKYYEFVLDSCNLMAPVRYRAEQASSYFASDSGYFYAYFQKEGTQTASATVKITGISTTKQINTDKASLSQQNNLKVQVTVTGKYPEGFTGTFGTTTSTRADSGTGYYTNIWLPFQYTKQAGYAVTINTTGEYGLAGDFFAEENGAVTSGDQKHENKADHTLLMKVHIGYHAGVGTSASKHTSHAAFLFNVTPSTYYVVYDGNGATSGATSLQTCRYGEKCFYRKNGFAREFVVDYRTEEGVAQRSSDRAVSRFKGWSDNKTTAKYAEESAFGNLTGTDQGSVTRFAIWENGTITLPKAFRTGYVFKGWKYGEEILAADTTVTPSRSETMEAVWEPNGYKIAFFREKDDTEPLQVQQLLYDEPAKLLSAEALMLKKDGYRFEGWESEKGIYRDGVSVINVTDRKDEVLKFYALWQKLEEGSQGEKEGSKDNENPVNDKKNSYGLTEKQVLELLKRLQNGSIEKLKIDKAEYTIVKQNDGTLEIKLVDTAGQGEITIPSSVTLGDKVFHITAVSDSAFKGNQTIKQVYVSSGIIKIGAYAFYQCKNLEKAEMPDTVMQIGKYAFGKCPKLKQVRFSKGCYEMGEGCFAEDGTLKSINLSGKLIRIPAKCFLKCGKLKKAVLGTDLTGIGKNAFEGCKSLGEIKIPLKVQTIGKKAFYHCKKLKKVNFRTKGMRKIGVKAFAKCHARLQFVVNASVKEKYQELLKGRY